MNDAVLDFGVGVNGFDGFRKTLQAIDAGNQDILDATIVQVG